MLEWKETFFCRYAEFYRFKQCDKVRKGQIWIVCMPAERSSEYEVLKSDAYFNPQRGLEISQHHPAGIYINPVIMHDDKLRSQVTEMIMGKKWLSEFYKSRKSEVCGLTLHELNMTTRVEISSSGEVVVETSMLSDLKNDLISYLLCYVSKNYQQLPSDYVFYRVDSYIEPIGSNFKQEKPSKAD